MRKLVVILGLAIMLIAAAPALCTGQQPKSLKEIYKTGKVRFVEELRISNGTLPEGVKLMFIGDLIEFHNGDVFILDDDAHHLLKYSPKGELIKVIGQHGQGPGDLYVPTCMTTDGKYIWVYELGNRRISIFTPDGGLVKTLKPDIIKKKSSIADMEFLSTGDFLICSEKNYRQGEKPQEKFIEIFSPNFEFRKTIYSGRYCQFRYVKNEPFIQPFARQVICTAGANGKLIYGFSENFKLEIYDLFSNKVHSITHKYDPIAITEQEKKDFFSGMTAGGVEFDKLSNSIKNRIIKNTSFPQYKPAFSSVIFDSEDNILVFPEERPSFFYAFDSQGKYINKVNIIEGKIVSIRMWRSKKNFLWFVDIGDSNEQSLVKCNIKDE